MNGRHHDELNDLLFDGMSTIDKQNVFHPGMTNDEYELVIAARKVKLAKSRYADAKHRLSWDASDTYSNGQPTDSAKYAKELFSKKSFSYRSTIKKLTDDLAKKAGLDE